MRSSQRVPAYAAGVGLTLIFGYIYYINDNAAPHTGPLGTEKSTVPVQEIPGTRRNLDGDQGKRNTADHTVDKTENTPKSNPANTVSNKAVINPKESDFTDDELLSETILITNATMKQPDMSWMGSGTKAFQYCKNLEPWMKCAYDPNAYEVWDKAEGVIFHGRHITKDHPVPSYRPPRQKWIFFESEPPPRVWDRVKVLNDVWGQFNFTTTYHRDSDLPYSYYRITCKPTPDWKPAGINFAQNKTKMIAWWVSHCTCDTRREKYVKEMKKYVPIDVMGSCGEPTCGSYVEGPRCVEDLLHQKYKFYLAYENSFCEDYYTEKLSKCLPINVIPVLMGLYNYSEFMPKGSYIDVRDFKGPKDLSMYLKYLDNNDTAYNEYIERKSQIQCEKIDPLAYSCKLCQYLHENRKRRQIAPDTRLTFSVNRHCISPKMFFKDIAQGIYSNIDTPSVFDSAGTDQVWNEKI